MKTQNDVNVNIYIARNQYVVTTEACINQNIHHQMARDDLDMLLEFIKLIDIPKTDVEELRKAIEDDDSRIEPSTFGPKVMEWVSKITRKIIESCYKVANQVVLTLIIEALSQYYGLN